MNTPEKIVECLNKQLNNYKQSVTQLSKTNKNDFIINDTIMFNWDDVSKLYDGDDSSSVDAIYCHIQDKNIKKKGLKRKNLHMMSITISIYVQITKN